MNTHDHDQDELPGDDELKALYRSLPRKEPSPALDAAIKRAAADAVRAQQQRKVMRWPVAVASVAVIVVAGGLGWRMMQQPSSVPQISATRDVVMSAAPSNEAAKPAPAESAIDAATHETAPVASAPAARMAASTMRKQENIRSAIKPRLVAPAVVAQQPPTAATEAAPMAGLSEDRVSDATLAAPAPPPAPAPPAPVAESTASAYAPSPAAPPTIMAGNQSERATMAMKTMAAPATVTAPDATAAQSSDTPTQELAKIRQLFALQRHDEAVQRLLAFRQAHPDVTLPDDLRAQLPDHE
ncbi:hypothetical protein [Dyella japonica]|uniref:Meckel syndrome type 1 protein n=1 Tax=Dyella japonica TaxID=231455 RepID=A0ABV2JPU1_9GAMM